MQQPERKLKPHWIGSVFQWRWEDRPSELKNMPIEFFQSEQQKENTRAHICIIKVPDKESGTLKNYFSKRVENIPNS